MNYDLQKASFLKRVSAWLLDMILLVVLATGCVFVISDLINYDAQVQKLDDCYTQYETKFNISFDLSQEDYNAMTEEERAAHDETVNAAYKVMTNDPEVMKVYSLVIQQMLLMLSIGIFLARLVLDFLVPLLFGNGQTIGKKLFGLGVMRTNSVRISGVALFIRSILGKYTIETMVPIFIFLMMFHGILGSIGTILLLVILLAQIVLMVATANNAAIHDKLSDTVVVDLPSQMIFDSQEARVAYQQRIAAEKAEQQPY